MYKDKRLWGLLFFPLTLVYCELVFHLLVFEQLNSEVLLPCLVALAVGCVPAALTSVFSRRINLILSWVFLSVIVFVYCGQRIYYYVFKFFMTPTAMGGNTRAFTEFFGQVASAIWDCRGAVLIFAVLFGLLGFLLKKRIVGEKLQWKLPLAVFAGGIGFGIVLYLALPLFGRDPMMPYDLLHEKWVQEFGYRRLGVAASVTQDCVMAFVKEEQDVEEEIEYVSVPVVPVIETKPTEAPVPTAEPVPTEAAGDTGETAPDATPTATPSPTPTPTPIDTSPNIIDIDFESLLENETSSKVKELHKYFSVAEGTRKNQYTGMFEGYNLISLCAEAFSPYLISEERTPTLYRMFSEGFQFTNFYQGIWYTSTSDGEYLMNTGLYPRQYNCMTKTHDNLMSFCLGNQFSRLGYECNAYHNNTYDYYNRHLSHPNMGYEYKGIGNGLKPQNAWPESDLLMVEETLQDYINAEKFHTYFMTVSGHKNYLFSQNSMARKNKELVADLDYSEPVLTYIAANMELEHALAYLVEELEKVGKLDKTVFVLTADHYPYGLTDEEMVELRGAPFETDLDLYRGCLLIWNSAMEGPIVSDKPCSNVDVLATVSNLFGLEYDSRMLSGNDILSDSPGYVLFDNRSFITEYCQYDTRTKELIVKEGITLPDGYVDTMRDVMETKFDIANKILNLDYYSKVPELAGR